MDNIQDKEVSTQIEGENTSIPVQPGDKVTITLTKEEKDLITEVKKIKAGEMKANEEKEDIIDIIDNTLALQVPAIDGTVATIEIPEDADIATADIDLAVDSDTMADIVTLVGAE